MKLLDEFPVSRVDVLLQPRGGFDAGDSGGHARDVPPICAVLKLLDLRLKDDELPLIRRHHGKHLGTLTASLFVVSHLDALPAASANLPS